MEDRLKKKFMKYQKILKEKDSQIDLLQQSRLESQFMGNFNNKNYIFDFKSQYRNFFKNWIIVDSIDSINGPSNWNLKNISKNDKNNKNPKILLVQSANIIRNDNANPSTSILFRDKIIQENIYFKTIFLSKVSGEIFINFKYLDFENYLQIKLIRENENKGKISLILNKNGILESIADLDCEKMISFLKKCSGFEIDELNKIEIYSLKEKYVVLFNDMIIFTFSLDQILKKNKEDFSSNKRNFNGYKFNYIYQNNKNSLNENPSWTTSRIQIGINNQKNLEIHDLKIKNLDFDDIKKFQTEISDMKNYAHGKNYELSNRVENKINEE